MAPRSIQLSDVRVWREEPLGGEARVVIDRISLQVAHGERVALVGANGAGKTSLLLALVGALPFAGRIAFDELELRPKTLSRIRSEVGFVFAEPADQLFLPTVREEVAFGPSQRGKSGDALESSVRDALERVGLGGFEDRAPRSLSLGEQRRLALSTALATDPTVLLLDEPTASLDSRARRAVLRAMQSTASTLLFATHDLDAALDLDARVVLLEGGRLLASGAAAELLFDERLLDEAGLDLPFAAATSRARGS